MAEKHPSIPSNYVSLAVLKQRWLEEQQRKQTEKQSSLPSNYVSLAMLKQRKEEELQTKQKEEDQKKLIPIQTEDKSSHKSSSSSSRPASHQIPRMRREQASTLNEPNIEDSDFVSEPVKSKLKKKGRKKPKKPKAEKTQLVPASLSPTVEKLVEDTAEINHKIEEAECEFPHNSVDQEAKANHNVPKPRVKTNTAGKMSFRRGDLQRKQTDCKQVWVKKGEASGTQSSGISMNAGMDKHQY